MCLQAMKTAANKETNKLLTFRKTTKTVGSSSSNKPQNQATSSNVLIWFLKSQGSHKISNFWLIWGKNYKIQRIKNTNYVSLSIVVFFNLFLFNSILFPLFSCLLRIFASHKKTYQALHALHMTTWHLVAISWKTICCFFSSRSIIRKQLQKLLWSLV